MSVPPSNHSKIEEVKFDSPTMNMKLGFDKPESPEEQLEILQGIRDALTEALRNVKGPLKEQIELDEEGLVMNIILEYSISQKADFSRVLCEFRLFRERSRE